MSSKNNTLEEIHSKIHSLVDKYFNVKSKKIKTGRFPLVIPSFGSEEVKEAIDSLLSTYVAMGRKCTQFEKAFANYVGVRYGLFVNTSRTIRTNFR